MKFNLFCSDQRKQKLLPVYNRINVPTITEDDMLLVILFVNKFEREHKEQQQQKKQNQETLICKCVFSIKKNKVCKCC